MLYILIPGLRAHLTYTGVMPPRGRGRPARAEVFRRLNMAMEDMQARFGGLPSRLEAEEIWRNIWREETHNSTAIEGNTLVQQEVDELLERGLTGPRTKALVEYLEVRGYADAAQWVYLTGIDSSGAWSTGELLSMQDVRYVHEMTVALAWRIAPSEDATDNEGPGCFREHEIKPFSGGMQPLSWPLVPAEMTGWLAKSIGSAPQVASP